VQPLLLGKILLRDDVGRIDIALQMNPLVAELTHDPCDVPALLYGLPSRFLEIGKFANMMDFQPLAQ
jgi:hypothetical protein